MALIVEKIYKVCVITINRPDAMNAIDPETNQELNEAWDDFKNDPDAWVAILTGAGEKAFCAGADLKKHITNQTGISEAERREQMEKPHGPFGAIVRNFTCFKPMIAAINGVCLGGGLEMALACDIRLASENAKLGLPEPKWGIMPGGGGAQRLLRIVPQSFAMEMLLDARTISAEEALRIGLVSRVCPQSELMKQAMALAESICEKAPLAIRAIKEAAIRGAHLSLDEAIRYEAGLRDFLMRSEDAKEGPRAFAEKRKPNFTAR